MKKVVLFILCLIMVVVSVFASESRITSMGGVGFFVEDNTNIFYFPGTLMNYKGQVVSELRMKNFDDTYSIGAHIPFSRSCFAVYVNSPLDISNYVFAYNLNVELNSKTDIIYASQLRSGIMAYRFSIGYDSYTEENSSDYEENAYFYEFACGFSNDSSDFQANLFLPGWKTDGAPTDEKWSGLGFGANYRRIIEKNSYEVIPVISFSYLSSKYEESFSGFDKDNTNEAEYGDLKLGFGLGFNYNLNDNNSVILAVEPFSIDRLSCDLDDVDLYDTKLVLPGVYIGVESNITTWLTGRIGATKSYYILKQKWNLNYQGDYNETTSYNESFDMSFGLGITFGNFVLDANINEGLLFSGPSFISGTEESMACKLSLTYNFNKD